VGGFVSFFSFSLVQKNNIWLVYQVQFLGQGVNTMTANKRMQELLSLSPKISNPSMTIVLAPTVTNTSYGMELRNDLVETYLEHVVLYSTVERTALFTPYSEEEQLLFEITQALNGQATSDSNLSSFLSECPLFLRFELNPHAMAIRNISPQRLCQT